MGANIGGIYGAQLFRADDRPKYHRGFSIGCAIVAFGVACAVFRYVVGGDVKSRRNQLDHQRRQGHLDEEEDGGAETRGRRRRLSSADVHGGHGAAMMRVATADGNGNGGNGNCYGDGDAEVTDGDTDETRVGTASSDEKAKGEEDGETDEVRKSDVIVREREREGEGGELRIVNDSADAYQMLEREIGVAR
jgi:hypothetical protein